jgi:hypothetical protein
VTDLIWIAFILGLGLLGFGLIRLLGKGGEGEGA